MKVTAAQNGDGPGPAAPDHDVIIVGAGFAGLAMAYRLMRDGREDFLILERGENVGGTWRDNRYPGCACDVQSHLYSFSWRLNPEWSRMFARQEEIQAYLEETATEIAVRPHLRFGANVTAAAYDEGAGVWRIEVNGDEEVTARVVVSAIGGLSNPAYADVPGIDDFQGPSFHSAEWDHGVDLEGKRVAVIGTGASAIQFVPQIAPKVGTLHLHQRTPPWVIPKRDRRIGRAERALYRRFPAVQRAYRRLIYWALESRVIAFSKRPAVMRAAKLLARAHIRRQIPDPELRRKVTPDYALGCKRVLISNDYYPALTRENVELHNGGVERVTSSGVVGADGREVEVDVIIHGTGFRVQETLVDLPVRGRGGEAASEVWARGGIQAHRGVAVAGFPNLFLLMGPNTGTGHTSAVFMIEAQAHYVIEALRTLDRRQAWSAEPLLAAQEKFNRRVQGMLDEAVWSAGGCRSWYMDENGRNTVLWPDFTYRFRRQAERFDPAEYVLAPHPQREPHDPARPAVAA